MHSAALRLFIVQCAMELRKACKRERETDAYSQIEVSSPVLWADQARVLQPLPVLGATVARLLACTYFLDELS